MATKKRQSQAKTQTVARVTRLFGEVLLATETLSFEEGAYLDVLTKRGNDGEINTALVLKVAYDMGRIEKFAKQVRGTAKEMIKAHLGSYQKAVITAETTNAEGTLCSVTGTISERRRAGGIDVARLIADHGEDFVAQYRLPPTEYEELRINMVPVVGDGDE